MRFIDSNVLLRYLTSDDASASALSAQIIRRVSDGTEEACTTDVHVYEVTCVLASKSLYALSHVDIRDRLRPLLLMKHLKISNKRLCVAALELFAQHDELDFADALAVALMQEQGTGEIYSFDRHFDQV